MQPRYHLSPAVYGRLRDFCTLSFRLDFALIITIPRLRTKNLDKGDILILK